MLKALLDLLLVNLKLVWLDLKLALNRGQMAGLEAEDQLLVEELRVLEASRPAEDKSNK
jgi:hypothetical protein